MYKYDHLRSLVRHLFFKINVYESVEATVWPRSNTVVEAQRHLHPVYVWDIQASQVALTLACTLLPPAGSLWCFSAGPLSQKLGPTSTPWRRWCRRSCPAWRGSTTSTSGSPTSTSTSRGPTLRSPPPAPRTPSRTATTPPDPGPRADPGRVRSQRRERATEAAWSARDTNCDAWRNGCHCTHNSAAEESGIEGACSFFRRGCGLVPG